MYNIWAMHCRHNGDNVRTADFICVVNPNSSLGITPFAQCGLRLNRLILTNCFHNTTTLFVPFNVYNQIYCNSCPWHIMYSTLTCWDSNKGQNFVQRNIDIDQITANTDLEFEYISRPECENNCAITMQQLRDMLANINNLSSSEYEIIYEILLQQSTT